MKEEKVKVPTRLTNLSPHPRPLCNTVDPAPIFLPPHLVSTASIPPRQEQRPSRSAPPLTSIALDDRSLPSPSSNNNERLIRPPTSLLPSMAIVVHSAHQSDLDSR